MFREENTNIYFLDFMEGTGIVITRKKNMSYRFIEKNNFLNRLVLC